MSSLSRLDKRPLYALLGLEQTATEAEVARAYRRLALQFHPDRNPDGVEQFKKLANAYAILSDRDKRALYDTTGIVPGSAEDLSTGGTDEKSTTERSEELREELAVFFKTYAGSDEETCDFVASYGTCGGDFRKMVREHLIFDNSDTEEIRRLHAFGAGLVSGGKLSPTDKWRLSTTQPGIKKIERYMRREREEAEAALLEMGLDEASVAQAKAARDNADLGALQALMQQRQKTAWASMMDGLEERYVDPEKERRRAEKFKGKGKSSDSGNGSAGKRKKPRKE